MSGLPGFGARKRISTRSPRLRSGASPQLPSSVQVSIPQEEVDLDRATTPSSTDVATLDAFELPLHVRNSSQDIKNLFWAAFGPVTSVQIVDPVSGHARVQFASVSDASACLRRIIQHEEMDDGALDGPPLSMHRGGRRRKGYVYLGYYRILVDGFLRVEQEADDSSSADAGHEEDEERSFSRDGPLMGTMAKKGRSKKRPRRSTSADRSSLSITTSDGDSAGSASGHSSSGDGDDGEDGERDRGGASDAPNVSEDHKQAQVPPPPPPNCLVLLRVVELPPTAQEATQDAPPAGTLSGLLSPLMVYQMLRDVCLPLKIVLCKKQQTPEHRQHNAASGGRTRRVFETRNVLVQLDKHESVAAVVSAFNGTVVELMEPAEQRSTSSAGVTEAAAPAGVHVSSFPQQPPKQRVAARFRVLACESRQDSGRPTELNVPVNIAGCMSISRSTIMKMGGIFDRSWVMPTSNSLHMDETTAVHHANETPTAPQRRVGSCAPKSASPRGRWAEDPDRHHDEIPRAHHHQLNLPRGESADRTFVKKKPNQHVEDQPFAPLPNSDAVMKGRTDQSALRKSITTVDGVTREEPRWAQNLEAPDEQKNTNHAHHDGGRAFHTATHASGHISAGVSVRVGHAAAPISVGGANDAPIPRHAVGNVPSVRIGAQWTTSKVGGSSAVSHLGSDGPPARPESPLAVRRIPRSSSRSDTSAVPLSIRVGGIETPSTRLVPPQDLQRQSMPAASGRQQGPSSTAVPGAPSCEGSSPKSYNARIVDNVDGPTCRREEASPRARQVPPPPPPRLAAAPAAVRWEAVFSEEYSRTYFVGTDVMTGEQRTTWELPFGARLS